MRLDRLEIKGFKSFADKTIVHVNEGVTAIVGPNGCGKSNVVEDALSHKENSKAIVLKAYPIVVKA